MADTHNFSDVFISYSRRNKAFVRKLEEGLRKTGQVGEIWIDWEDIKPSADWWSEIQAGIEGANTFLFILTPDSARSEVCHREVEHAVQSHKRIVPIAHIDVTDPADIEKIHPAIQSHNWLPFPDGTNFDGKITELISVLTTNLDHVNKHTRLFVRAKEWIQNNRDNSYLLTGVEIDIAERWLREADQRQLHPPPDDIHREYIETSRRIDRESKQHLADLIEARKASEEHARIALEEQEKAKHHAEIAQKEREQAEIQAQESNKASHRSRRLAIIAGVSTVIALIVGILALRQSGIAEAETRDAVSLRATVEAESYLFQLAGQALFRQNNENDALAYAFEAMANEHPPDDVKIIFKKIANNAYNRRTMMTPSEVNSVSFSPDGTRLASAGNDSVISVWDAKTGTILNTFTVPETNVSQILFSPDGQAIASVSDAMLRLWDVETGDMRFEYEHAESIIDITFNPDGTFLVFVSFDNRIHFIDAGTGDILESISNSLTSQITALALSPYGEFLALGDDFGGVYLLDMFSGELAEMPAGHTRMITSLAFSPTGTMLASSSEDTTVKLWNIETRKVSITFYEHAAAVQRVAFSSDGNSLVSASDDNTIKLWKVNTGQEVANLGRSIRTYSGHIGGVKDVVFRPDGQTFASASADKTIKLWNITNAQDRQTNSNQAITLFGHIDQVSAVTFSPDGSMVASGGADTVIRLWDANTGQQLKILSGHGAWINSLDFSSDGSILASASDDATVRLWDVATGEQRFVLDNQFDYVTSVSFSPDGTMVATTGNDNAIRLWDAETGDLLLVLTGHESTVSKAVFSPDGSRLASTSLGEVFIWDVATGELIRRLIGHDDWVTDVDFSPDGKRLASASIDQAINLWDVETGEFIMRLVGHTDWVRSIAFSPDGKTLASTGDDLTVRLWDVASGGVLQTFTGHQDWIMSVAFSPTGNKLASASYDNTVKLWQWTADDGTVDDSLVMRHWVQQNLYVREFDCNEREYYDMPAKCKDGAYEPRTPYPTFTPAPTLTPIAVSSVGTPLPTVTPTMNPTVTPVPTLYFTPFFYSQTATPMDTVEDIVQPASIGDNAGHLVIGNSDFWSYQAEAGEALTIQTFAGWDTVLTVSNSVGETLQYNDDNDSGTVLSRIDFVFPEAGTYFIIVGGFDNQNGGEYILSIESVEAQP